MEDGYTVNNADPCVLNKLVNNKQSTVLIHVDDIMCLCVEKKAHDDLANLLKRKFKETKYNKGLVLSYLGMTFDFSEKGKIKVSMEGFVEDLIVHCDENGSATTPANNALFESELTDDPLEEKERKRFHSYICLNE